MNDWDFKFLEKQGMKFEIDMIKLNKCLKSTDFERMKNKEKEETFFEAVLDESGKRKDFFNLGPSNDWRKILDKNNRDKIEKNFEKEMVELEYL